MYSDKVLATKILNTYDCGRVGVFTTWFVVLSRNKLESFEKALSAL